MDKAIFWTRSGARFQLFRRFKESHLNWLFLPGGPGLGSESLLQLLDLLNLPGSTWQLDLPGDGSNTTLNNKGSFALWSLALLEAVSEFKHVILVAHSTGGMYALSAQEIEKFLHGLILLDSAPDAGWQKSFGEIQKNLPIPELDLLHQAYRNAPSNEALKAITVASAPYLFTREGLEAGINMLNSLPYNFETCQWSEEHFDQTYRAKWIPETIPTLILSGEYDLITPLKLFEDEQSFHRKNILFKSIKNGGHFPWIENPLEVTAAFNKYTKTISK